MLAARPSETLPSAFFNKVGAIWALVSALLIAINWNAITGMRFPDPDDAMRLVQVRDLIAGQSWFDLTQYRSDAANGGVAMHWSRLVDIPLVFVIAVLTPLLGVGLAETVAVVLVPLVTLLLVMLLAARIAWKLLGEEEATFTCLMLAIAIPVLFQLGPMRIDHHGWQIVTALGVVNALLARCAWLGGALIGAISAVWVSISIEGLPLSAAIFGVLALRWLRDRNTRGWLLSAIVSLAVTSAALFVLTRGFTALANSCDAISPVHLGVFAWGAAVLAGLSRAEPIPRASLIAGFAVAAGGAIGLMLYAAPQCASGGFSAINPVAEKYWLSQISEGLPIWRQDIATMLQYAVTPVIGLIAAMRLARASGDGLRRFWGDYAIIIAAALAVSLLVSRAGAVACALAAPPLAWQVREWLRRIRKMDRPAPRIMSMLGVVCALLPAFPAMVLTSAIAAQASREGSTIAMARASACEVENNVDALNAQPVAEVFAPMDIGPSLLLETDHTVIATAHHRGHEGIRTLIEISLASPNEARAMLTKRGTGYVALCPGLNEAQMYARIAPQGFAAKLVAGDAPEWLEPVILDDELQVWKIMP